MTDEISFGTLAELSVTLAGFSGLIAALRHRPMSQWHPRVRLNFVLALIYSFGGLLFALLPSMLHDLGLHDWVAQNALFLISGVLFAGFSAREDRRLNRAGFLKRARHTWIVAWALGATALLVVTFGLFGIANQSAAGAYHFVVCVIVALAALSFVAVLQYPDDSGENT